ncbi:Lsg locus putative protein 1 [Pectobacterium carotovorum subsp. carotovorum]|nr:Lsg locus putative protein 1 [Pectobacterium carotovorum subsp. carotovorum]
MSVVKDSVVYLIGEVISKGIPYFLLPFVASSLGNEEYGRLAYYQVFVVLSTIIIGLSQDGAVSRYYYTYGVRAVNLVIYSGAVYAVIVTLFLFMVLSVFDIKSEYYLCVGAAFFSVMLSTQLSLNQCQRYVKKYLLIQIANSVCTMAFIIIFFSIHHASVFLYFSSVILSSFISLFICFVFLFNKGKLKWMNFYRFKKYNVYLFSFGFPLVFHQLSIFAKGQVDRLFVFNGFGLKELGVYSLGVQVATAYSVFIMALNKAILPYYFKSLKEKKLSEEKILFYSFFSIFICFIPALFFFIIPSAWYTLIFGSDFSGVKYYVVFFVFSFGLNIPYLLIVNYFFYYGKTSLISKVTFTSSLLYVAMLYFLSRHSLHYLPFSLLISNVFMLCVFYFLLYKYSKG